MAKSARKIGAPVANVLEIKNFKSLKHIKISPSRVNIFLGKPNSGKSNLLEALTLFNGIQSKKNRQSHATLVRYNTLDNLFYDRDVYNDIEIKFKENLAILSYQPASNCYVQAINPNSIYLKNKREYFKENISLNDVLGKGPILSKTENTSLYPSQFAVFDQEGQIIQQTFGEVRKESPIRRYEFRDGIDYSDPFRDYLKSSGENLFTIVQESPKVREWITSFFEDFKLEFLIDFSSKKFEIQKKENGIVYKIPFELTPDTLRRMLFYVAAIYSNSNSTILMEEPEAHSFPPYIKELTELIKLDSKNIYFITTHSPYLINSFIEDSEKIEGFSFYHVYYEDFQTKISKLGKKDIASLWDSSADIFFNVDSLNK